MRENLIMIKKEQVISTFNQPKTLTRSSSAVLDIAIFVIAGYIFSLGTTTIMTSSSTDYAKNQQMIDEHTNGSHLAFYDEEKGNLLYSADQLLSFDEENKLVFTNVVTYYYLQYLTGNVEEGSIYSLEYDKEISEGVLQKDYYSADWFNNEILEIDNETSYFVVEEGSSIGSLKPEYINENKVVENEDLSTFVYGKYYSAVEHFFKQSFMMEASENNEDIGMIVFFFSYLASALIFFLVIPITNKFGLTLGRKLMGLIVINDDGLLLKRYKLILKLIPLIVIIAIMAFVHSFIWQMTSCFLIVLASIGLSLFTKYKQSLSDIIARTIIVSREDAIVCENYDDFEKVFCSQTEVKNDGGQ